MCVRLDGELSKVSSAQDEESCVRCGVRFILNFFHSSFFDVLLFFSFERVLAVNFGVEESLEESMWMFAFM